MEFIGIISSVIAAVASIIALCYSIRMSKGNIRRRIEKKKEQIHEIENKLRARYGIYDNGKMRPLNSLDKKKAKLLSEIHELEKEL